MANDKVQLTKDGQDIYPVTVPDAVAGLDTALSGKQATLVSGTNIKTINGESLLGSGDIETQGDGIFKVTPYVTPFQDIWDAHEAGKLCVIDAGDDEQYLLGAIGEGRAFFYQVYEEGSVYWIKVDASDEWTDGNYTIYSLPDGGIPETDLASAVTAKLNKEEIFIAEYGVTTQAEIYAAYQAGKLVVAKSQSALYYPYYIETRAVHFFNIYDDVISIVIVTASLGWRKTDEYSFVTGDLLSDINEKYRKPSGGIPKTDLASAVQTSLGKADTALQSFTEADPIFLASVAHGITSSDITNWNGKYTKPANGIPATDLADGVIPEAVVAQELSIDSTPTANSANLVTSGGVYAAIGDIETLLAAI